MSIDAAVSKSAVLKLLLLPLIAYTFICLLVFLTQRKLIYMPSRVNAQLPGDFEQWEGATNSGAPEFWGFKRVATNSASSSGSNQRFTTCLFFLHGNGGNASGWAHAVEDFPGDIFVLEYPGYGERPGTPTEKSIKSAALRAFEGELAKSNQSYDRIVLCGQSLGAGVTEAIFSRHPEKLHALVLITPFLSLAEVASTHYWWLPTRLMLRDKLRLHEDFLRFPGKSVIITASDDEVIPRSHGQRYHAAKNENRAVIEFHASHNTVNLDRAFWENVLTGEAWKGSN